MKKLIDEVKLNDTKEISIGEFRKNPGEIFQQVQMGRSFYITKLGKVIAWLTKPEPNAFELGAAARVPRCQHGNPMTANCPGCAEIFRGIAGREVRNPRRG